MNRIVKFPIGTEVKIKVGARKGKLAVVDFLYGAMNYKCKDCD